MAPCGISPVGTAERRLIRPSLRDLRPFRRDPSVETLGYCHPSLRDEAAQILVTLDFQSAVSQVSNPRAPFEGQVRDQGDQQVDDGGQQDQAELKAPGEIGGTPN